MANIRSNPTSFEDCGGHPISQHLFDDLWCLFIQSLRPILRDEDWFILMGLAQPQVIDRYLCYQRWAVHYQPPPHYTFQREIEREFLERERERSGCLSSIGGSPPQMAWPCISITSHTFFPFLLHSGMWFMDLEEKHPLQLCTFPLVPLVTNQTTVEP